MVNWDLQTEIALASVTRLAREVRRQMDSGEIQILQNPLTSFYEDEEQMKSMLSVNIAFAKLKISAANN